MKTLAKNVLSAKKRKFLSSGPIFELFKTTSTIDLEKLEERIDSPLPKDLKDWLLIVGYGDINDELSFRADWIKKIHVNTLGEHLLFAQDILGNFYSINNDGEIYFISRSEPAYGIISKSFKKFIEEIISRDYKIMSWVNSIETQKYDLNP